MGRRPNGDSATAGWWGNKLFGFDQGLVERYCVIKIGSCRDQRVLYVQGLRIEEDAKLKLRGRRSRWLWWFPLFTEGSTPPSAVVEVWEDHSNEQS